VGRRRVGVLENRLSIQYRADFFAYFAQCQRVRARDIDYMPSGQIERGGECRGGVFHEHRVEPQPVAAVQLDRTRMTDGLDQARDEHVGLLAGPVDKEWAQYGPGLEEGAVVLQLNFSAQLASQIKTECRIDDERIALAQHAVAPATIHP